MFLHKQNYRMLKIGDVRQSGDEVRHLTGGLTGGFCLREDEAIRQADNAGKFRYCTLIGHPVLPVDLVATEIRRVL